VTARPGGDTPVPQQRAGVSPYAQGMGVLNDLADIPADRARIADTDLITPVVWAALQGVELSTFYSMNARSRAHRRHDAEHPDAKRQVVPGDIPPEDETAGQTPMWYMSTYRAWWAQRPGQASARGKAGAQGSRGGRGPGRQVRLPIECPHCHTEITGEELDAAEAALRERYTGLRDAGVAAKQAAAELRLSEQRARSLEMSWRRTGRGGAAAVEAATRRRAVTA